MWCRRRRIGRRRRPSRRNGYCIRRRRRWRCRAGRKFRISLMPDRGAARPGACPISIGARPILALRTARRGRGVPLPPAAPVAAANDVAAGRHAGRAAGSGGEPFQNPGIGAPDPAGPVRAPGGSMRRPVQRKSPSAKVAGKSRRHGRAAATQPPASAGHAEQIAAKRRRDRPQAGGASQTERAIGSGRRVEEALIGRF